MSQVINIDPEILGGTPVFMGTRVPIIALFDALKHGRSIDYFLEDFPSVSPEQTRPSHENKIRALLDEAESKTLASPVAS